MQEKHQTTREGLDKYTDTKPSAIKKELLVWQKHVSSSSSLTKTCFQQLYLSFPCGLMFLLHLIEQVSLFLMELGLVTVYLSGLPLVV